MEERQKERQKDRKWNEINSIQHYKRDVVRSVHTTVTTVTKTFEQTGDADTEAKNGEIVKKRHKSHQLLYFDVV